MNYKALVKKAQAARKYSYSPYSHFRVGAAILTTSGKIFTGCNIENSSFGLTICAERTAIFKAVSEGHKKFKAIAVATDEDEFVAPCGACRQVLMDLAGGDIDFVLSKNNGETSVMKLSELYPYPFSAKDFVKE